MLIKFIIITSIIKMLIMKSDFGDWLAREIEKRGLSQREVARKVGLSSGAISQVTTGKNFPGPDFCSAIARAFNLPADDVFRRAGLLPPAPERTPGLIEAEHLFTLLKPGQRELLLQTMRAWVSTDPITEDAET